MQIIRQKGRLAGSHSGPIYHNSKQPGCAALWSTLSVVKKVSGASEGALKCP